MSSPHALNDIQDIRFRLSPAFKLLENSENKPSKDICDKKGNDDNYYETFFLQHQETAARIQTDSMGHGILKQLPASFQELKEQFADSSFYMSPKLLGYYLLLFRHAGVIESEDGTKPTTQHEAVSDDSGSADATAQSPGISAVMVTFNGEKFIRKNLESLFKQSLVADEIILVDNASTDGSIDTICNEFPQVKVIRNTRNYHYAQAVNIGVAAASNPLVLILNQDLEADKDFIYHLYLRYATEENKEQVAGIVPQMRFSRLRPFINGIGNFITPKNWGSDNYFGVLDIGQFHRLRYTGSACFGAIMVTKEAWAKVGPLDKTFKSFYEDADWSIRAHLEGLNLLAAPKSIVYHAFGGSYPSGLKLTFIAKNRMRFVFKHLKGKTRGKFFKKYLKQDIKNTLSFIRSGCYKNVFCYMKAYVKLFLEFPNILFHILKRKKRPCRTIDAFFTKHTPYVALANKTLDPVIDKHVIRSYYYYTELDDFTFPDEPIVLQ